MSNLLIASQLAMATEEMRKMKREIDNKIKAKEKEHSFLRVKDKDGKEIAIRKRDISFFYALYPEELENEMKETLIGMRSGAEIEVKEDYEEIKYLIGG